MRCNLRACAQLALTKLLHVPSLHPNPASVSPQVTVEPLYPPELASLSVRHSHTLTLTLTLPDPDPDPNPNPNPNPNQVADFMAALPSLDAGFTQRVAAAAAAGKVRRYACFKPAVSLL